MKDENHSFGHSDSCYWCGWCPDDEPEHPCDERLNKRPTEPEMNHYYCVTAIEDARYVLEQAELTCEKHGYRETGKGVYDARLRLSETLRQLEGMRPPSQRQGNE